MTQAVLSQEQGIRDLMGLLALPALWAGRDSETVLRLTIEAVERLLPVQLVYTRLKIIENPRFDSLLRVENRYLGDDERAHWEARAQDWQTSRAPDGRGYEATTPLGRMCIVHLSMGYGSFGGKIWFGSLQPGFPTVTQLAILRAAASLAATGVQAARANYEREQASRAKDEFLAMLGHELRNPLAPIVMALELIKLKQNGAGTREYQIIERQAHHLSRLVDDLLDVTRMTRGKLELKKAPAELTGLLTRALEDTGGLFTERQHRLTAALPDGEVWVYGDATRLVQVFANLLSNAAKYTDPGGEIRVGMVVENHQALISVEDNGSGISPQLFPRLFQIFEQGVATIDRAKGGLGIGLALVKTFVELHEGQVGASSPGIGQGSTFTVRLPLFERGAEEVHQASHEAWDSETMPVRVLIVDDNLDALESTRDYLRKRGHRVEASSDPLEALGIARRFRPEVAVLDIGLPVMSGYELAAALRAEFNAAELRLVALTGYGQMKDLERSRAAGFDLHLVKPVSLRQLDAALSLKPSSAR